MISTPGVTDIPALQLLFTLLTAWLDRQKRDVLRYLLRENSCASPPPARTTPAVKPTTIGAKSGPSAGALLLSITTLHAAADWPQCKARSHSTVTRDRPPQGMARGGPSIVWTATGLGSGYGSMAVSGDRVFVQGVRGRNSAVIALCRERPVRAHAAAAFSI